MEEVFEIVDFVVASPFERLVQEAERICKELEGKEGNGNEGIGHEGIGNEGIGNEGIGNEGIGNDQLDGQGIQDSKTLVFKQFIFNLSLHSIKNPDPLFITTSLAFAPYDPPNLISQIHRCTGLSQFITLSCDNVPFVVAKTIASAAITANCHLPVFIQHGPSLHQTFYGVSCNNRFKMAYAPLSGNLSFLLDLFMQRYSVPCTLASILTGYELEFVNPVSFLSNGFTYGQKFDPVRKLVLETIYPPANVDTYIDATVDHVLSPIWNLYMTPQIDLMILCRVFKRAIRDFAALLTFNPFLDTTSDFFIPGAFANDLHPPSDMSRKYLNSQQINHVIDRIFSTCTLSYSQCIKKSVLNTPQVYQTTTLISLLRFKNCSVPKDSLLWRLASTLLDSCKQTPSLLKLETGMIALIKVIWPRFLLELQRLWDADLFIPGINISQNYKSETAKVDVDSHHNILHQKLCMINCCLYRKTNLAPTIDNRELALEQARLRQEEQQKTPNGNAAISITQTQKLHVNMTVSPSEEKNYSFVGVSPPSRQISFASSWSSDKSWSKIDPIKTRTLSKSDQRANAESSLDPINDEDQDIFFDALGWELPAANTSTPKPLSREGHLKELDMILIKTQEKMWEPITQESGYMTDDMAREQEEILEKLGTSDHARQYRSLIQSAQLVSDMEAFMAANPGAMLEDFVRWHSPKDWVGGLQDGKGTLSSRMSEADNLWRTLWNQSKPVPCSKQKKLFDHEKEKEKAFYYLESLTAYQVVLFLIPTFALIVYDTLSQNEISSKLETTKSHMARLGKAIVSQAWSEENKDFGYLIKLMNDAETIITMAHSLLQKFPEQYELVDNLLQSSSSLVPFSSREAVYNLFDGLPTFRDYILQSDDDKWIFGRINSGLFVVEGSGKRI